MAQKEVVIKFPALERVMIPKFIPLVKCTDRYLTLLGGRGSGKSTAVAQIVILRMLTHKFFRGVGIRKLYNNVGDSIFKNIVDQIKEWDLTNLFSVRTSPFRIECVNGNSMIFRGLDSPTSLKSLKDVTFCWYEEECCETLEDFLTIDSSFRTKRADFIQTVHTMNPVLEGNPVEHWFYQHFGYGETPSLNFTKEINGKINDKELSFTYRSMHCFVGETEILTRSGLKRIDSIKVGDEVLSRNGWRKVLHCHSNGLREVRKWRFTDLESKITKIIECTPDHEFWTVENGFVEINKLSLTETTFIISDDITGIWKERKYFIEDLSSLSNQMDISQNQSKENPGDFIGMYGFVKKGKYQKDMKFTTSMVTKKIMKSEILNVYQDLSISKDIRKDYMRDVLLKCISGIGVKRVERNLVRRLRKGHQPLSKLTNVSHVVLKLIERCSIQRENIVLGDANQELIKESTTKRKEVYDITVDGEHEYFANGILVHNSTYKDNPYLPNEYKLQLESIKDEYLYSVNTLGIWSMKEISDRFYKSFNLKRNVGKFQYNRDKHIYLGVDFNVYPFSAMAVFQIDGKKMYQIDEICVNDKNISSIRAACHEFARRYADHYLKVIVVGDVTGKKDDTKHEKGYNNYSIIEQELKSFNLVIDLPSSNPPVIGRGEFTNRIFSDNYRGCEFWINENCPNTINDFLYLKQDFDGDVKKELVKNKDNGRRYEKWGHLSDASTYLLCRIFSSDFEHFKSAGAKFEPVYGKIKKTGRW